MLSPFTNNKGSSLVTPLKRATRNIRDYDTPIEFVKFKASDGPEAGETVEVSLFKCMAEIDSVWLRDYEQAVANGTQSDIKLFMRDTLGEYIPNDETDKVYINHHYFADKVYKVKSVAPDPRDQRNIMVVIGDMSGN